MSAVDNEVFEQKLDKELKNLEDCQKKHQVKSCSDCEHYIGCEVRKNYVNAVYNSMSKGATGGFEF
jgi:hypothetical protein